MKIAVLGGAGAMARTIVKDLSESKAVEKILVADYREKEAKAYAASFNDDRIGGSFVDASDIDKTAELIKDYDVLINAAQHFVNIPAMKACLKGGCHYTDLGGLFHITLKQMELFDDFEQAGLTAVICMGSAPGITNVLARYAYDNLDTVEKVILSDGILDLTDMKGADVFISPYSIRTIMSEFADDAVMYTDGQFVSIAPSSGKIEIDFPEPIGRRECIQTLHSEPATIPASFKEKGIKEVKWYLSLPPELEAKVSFLASLGFDKSELLKIHGTEVAPIDVLAAVIEKQIQEKCKNLQFEINDMECLRAQVTGTKEGENMEFVVDCIVKTHSRWKCSSGDLCTGVPPSIIAQMLGGKMITQPGVWPPEQIVEPVEFFRQLSAREMHVGVSINKTLF